MHLLGFVCIVHSTGNDFAIFFLKTVLFFILLKTIIPSLMSFQGPNLFEAWHYYCFAVMSGLPSTVGLCIYGERLVSGL